MKLSHTIYIVILLALGQNLAAQQQDQENSVETDSESVAENSEIANTSPESGNFQTFRPSEDISEDQSVPFPSDI